MTVNLNSDTLRKRVAAFAKDFSKSTYEMGEAQDFIRGLKFLNGYALHEESCKDPYARLCGQTGAAAFSDPVFTKSQL